MKKKFHLLALIFGCAASAFATETPPAILVNGITTIFGDVRVLFKVGEDAGKNFMLAVGQQQDGIRLLEVEVQKGVVQFDNHGVLQKISICSTPELVSSPQKPAGKAFDGRPSSALAAVADAAASAAPKNSEPLSRSFDLVGAGAGKKANSSSDSSNDKGAAMDGTADKKNDAGQNSWWYRAAEEMEAARLATAASVRNGEHPAYPLTPLTPPGMDARLIGDGWLYFNHFQRFIGPGLLAKQ